MAAPTNTVILGTGIIGLSTAYFLSQSSRTLTSSIHLVDSSPSLFASASGYAGGFLAKDWFGPATASLGALSFSLHEKIANENGGHEKWGFSRSTGTSYASTSTKSGDGAEARGEDWLIEGHSRADVAVSEHEFVSKGSSPNWLTRRSGDRLDIIGGSDSVAQIDPLRLCKWLLAECERRGIDVHYPAKAISVSRDMRNELASIRIAIDGGAEVDLPCSRVIITAGVWSPQVFKTLFPLSKKTIPITSLSGHSLVAKSVKWTEEHEKGGCHAVFATDSEGFSPEIFSRIGGEIYIAGLNDADMPPPEIAGQAKPDAECVDRLTRVCQKMLGAEGDNTSFEVMRTGLCFRPVGPNGVPLLCRIPDEMLGDGWRTRTGADGGVFLSAGHGPWGISLSLGTGKCLADLVENQRLEADIHALAI